jgi:hypothetical protein
MISIICTNCQAELSIDDAFAGGVCRCQYCGTIQTVPAKGKPQARAAAPQPAAAPASKTLYQNKARVRQANSTGTGLDDLADAVVSSGLGGSGLSSSRHAAKAPAEPRKQKNLLPIILIACGVLIVLLGILIAVLLSHGHASGGGGGTSGGGGSGTDLASGSSFCGISLHFPTTIFLLDRGNSISNDFDTVKAACFKSIDQFGPSRKFQVILWDNNDATSSAEFPQGKMADATAGNIASLRQYFQDTVATGSARLSGPLREAVSRNPQEIVIVTGKGADNLDEDDAAVLRSMIGKNIRIDAVQIYPSTPSPNSVLQEVSKASGGQFKTVSSSELRDFAR